MVVASRTPCHACTHDGAGRVLDTQPSAGTLDTNTDLRLPAGTAARAKIKHPLSARARCDKHTHHREENLRNPRQMLHESASDAFAMQSNPSNCSWCNTPKLKFYIHCCSTCHAFPRNHMNLGIAPHTLFIHGIWICASFQTAHPTTLRTRFKLISTPCAPPTILKAAGIGVSGRVSPARPWRGTRCVDHKRRLEGLCQRAGALITDVVAKEIQFGDGDIGLVLKQPWHMPALAKDLELIWQRNSS